MLSPGAAVLSDKGILCIDEFEKLREVDRVCLHDVMESGIVHISKALGKSSLGFTFYTLPVLCWCFKDPFTLQRSDLFMKYPL